MVGSLLPVAIAVAILYVRRTSLIFLNGIYASVKFMLAKYY